MRHPAAPVRVRRKICGLGGGAGLVVTDQALVASSVLVGRMENRNPPFKGRHNEGMRFGEWWCCRMAARRGRRSQADEIASGGSDLSAGRQASPCGHPQGCAADIIELGVDGPPSLASLQWTKATCACSTWHEMACAFFCTRQEGVARVSIEGLTP